MSEVYSQSIVSNLALPFHLEDQIGLNVKKAEWLAQLGGIRSVFIKNDSSGETSKVQGTVVGMNGDGSAMAGATKVDYMPTSSLEMKQDKYKIQSARWANIIIKINTEELKERLLRSDKVVSKTGTWVPYINTAIQKEMRKAGNKQLLSMLPADYFSFFWFNGWSLYESIKTHIDNPNPLIIGASFIGWNILYGIFINTLDTLTYGAENRGDGKRYTFGIGLEPDRAVVFNLAFLGKPLIKDLSK